MKVISKLDHSMLKGDNYQSSEQFKMCNKTMYIWRLELFTYSTKIHVYLPKLWLLLKKKVIQNGVYFLLQLYLQTCFPWSQKPTQSQTWRGAGQVHTVPHPLHVDTQELKEGQINNRKLKA